MTLSVATDKSETYRQKVEVTAATRLPWLREPEGTRAYGSANTDLTAAGLFGAVIECSVMKPGCGILAQGYAPPSADQDYSLVFQTLAGVGGVDFSGGTFELPHVQMQIARNSVDYATGLSGYGSAGYGSVGYVSGSVLRESAGLIYTYGQCCTLIENESFSFGFEPSRIQGHVVGAEAALTLCASNLAGLQFQAVYIEGASATMPKFSPEPWQEVVEIYSEELDRETANLILRF